MYLTRTRVAAPEVATYDWSSSPYADANRQEFDHLTTRYGEALRNEHLAPLLLRPADDIGWGVFADGFLAVDDLLGEYTGVIQPANDAPAHLQEKGHYLSDYSWNYPDELPDGREFEVNAFYEGNILRFVNHSPKPNCAVDHTLVDGLFVTFFRVIEAVVPGQQLLVDYGEAYWSGGYRSMVEL